MNPRNRLRDELSPYLRQHADNPVDWWPWCPAALETARRDDRPILLSVGYSACHWCHVMAHECFENPRIAALMNRWFVNIKVDREERPDLDGLYQLVCQLLTRQGGWPLTVFLTPAGEPFFAGTYFPPDERYGRPGFPKVLEALAAAWSDHRDQVTEQAAQLVAAIERVQAIEAPGPLSADLLDRAGRQLLAQVDWTHGGLGDAPKFPNPFSLELLLRRHAALGDDEPLRAAVRACEAMHAGGIWDHLGGGFHRYSVDEAWRVPHFEKMLYDNALLVPVYLAAWQATGRPSLAACARDTLDYLLAEMRAPGGAFYATTDADSEGEEGRYFVWRPEQVAELFDAETAALVAERFGITHRGNFEHGATVLSAARSIDDLAAARGLTADAVAATLESARQAMLAARRQRVAPFRDEKILTCWNGLAIRAFAQAGLILGEPRYTDAARRTAAFCCDELMIDGRPRRVHQSGAARIGGFLDDYAALALGLLDLFAATGEPRWFQTAADLTATILRDFHADGVLHLTARDAEALVVRPMDTHDHATPSGLSLTAHALGRLAALTGDPTDRRALERILTVHAGAMRDNAWGTAWLLAALDDFLAEPVSVVVVGDGPEAEALRAAAVSGYDPHRLVCRRPSTATDDTLPALLRGRTLRDGRPAAYLCRGMVCEAPLTSPDDLAGRLARTNR